MPYDQMQELKNMLIEHQEEINNKLVPIQEHIEQVKPFLEAYNAGKTMARISAKVVIAISTIGGALLVLRELLK
jgi:hypothetical protein